MILLFLLTSYIADDGRWCTIGQNITRS